MSERYTVRAERCDHRASPQEIYRTLERITEPLTRSWERLERARRIVIKFNMMHPDTARHHGRRQELVDEEVMRAVLRLLRARTNATLIATDTCVHTADKTVPSNFESSDVLREFGVELIDAATPPLRLYDVPGGGNMFDRYLLTSCIGETDEFISVAKMKNPPVHGRHPVHEEPVRVAAAEPAGGARPPLLPSRHPAVLRAPGPGHDHRPLPEHHRRAGRSAGQRMGWPAGSARRADRRRPDPPPPTRARPT